MKKNLNKMTKKELIAEIKEITELFSHREIRKHIGDKLLVRIRVMSKTKELNMQEIIHPAYIRDSLNHCGYSLEKHINEL